MSKPNVDEEIPIPPPVESEFPLSPAQVGMATFLCSEAAFFSTLVVAYLIYLGEDQTGPTPAESLSLTRAVINSAFLLGSSGTIMLAMNARKAKSLNGFSVWMFGTITLGVLFLVGTAYEWEELIYQDGLTIGRNLFGTTFYTLIGFHAFHVTLGLVLLTVITFLERAGRLSAKSEATELVSWYWHFVDAVWIVIFGVVYWMGT
ncbi:cytochrome c oxidase subunit 3 [Blastopirellula marina]|uniref:Cytochrome bo(3) ubiquinol oxidase subunit 3 n=1 Tax=Blastopirellula marina DSM 3645 TaxID=314230 RepID=A4A2K1_9BACT|nr:cytochrome c oxidase subunit 3 [Blastopirellula marina]EAQ77021.1 cytochrome C oxidase subunit III [Blastopirellula marina DSM 3645]